MGLNDIRNLMIGAVVMMIVVVGGITILGGFSPLASDPTNQIGNFSQGLDKSSEVTDSVNSINADLQSVSSKNNPLGWLDVLVGGAFNSLKAIGGTLSFMSIMAGNMGMILGVPGWIVTLGLLVVTIIIVFAIWIAITRS